MAHRIGVGFGTRRWGRRVSPAGAAHDCSALHHDTRTHTHTHTRRHKSEKGTLQPSLVSYLSPSTEICSRCCPSSLALSLFSFAFTIAASVRFSAKLTANQYGSGVALPRPTIGRTEGADADGGASLGRPIADLLQTLVRRGSKTSGADAPDIAGPIAIDDLARTGTGSGSGAPLPDGVWLAPPPAPDARFSTRPSHALVSRSQSSRRALFT